MAEKKASPSSLETLLPKVSANIAHFRILIRILSNIANHPFNPKFRLLKLSNKKVSHLISHKENLDLLLHVGFTKDDKKLMLPSEASIDNLKAVLSKMEKLAQELNINQYQDVECIGELLDRFEAVLAQKSNEEFLLNSLPNNVEIQSQFPELKPYFGKYATRAVKICSKYFLRLNKYIAFIANFAGLLIESGGEVEEEASLEFANLLATIIISAHSALENKAKHFSIDVIKDICPPAAVFLSPSKSARRKLQNNEQVVEAINAIRFTNPSRKMLHMLVEVLDDEEILVLLPEEQRCFQIIISGIAENTQLQVLIADRLIRKYNVSGKPPDEDIVKCLEGTGPQQIFHKRMYCLWNMYNWTILNKDGKIPDEFDDLTDHWVWCEGTPSDIAYFEDKRVLILGPPSYVRSYNCCRMFDPLKAEMKVVKELEKQEVQKLIQKIAKADEKTRNETLEFLKDRK